MTGGKEWENMERKAVNLIVGFILVAAVLSGCRISPPAEVRTVPAALKVPEEFVALFDDGSRRWIYGEGPLMEKRFPPCSTFKIVSTLLGLDCGVVTGPDSRLGYDETHYETAAWNRDLSLREAFQLSCVPYYKKLMGKLEKSYVQRRLDALAYGNCDISVWNSNGHNVFWIESSLLISPEEQIAVLRRIFSVASPFSSKQVAILKECMAAGSVGTFSLYGKTGTGRNHNTNRLEAWYVGFVEDGCGRRIFFAAHGADRAHDVSSPEVRAAVQEILSGLP